MNREEYYNRVKKTRNKIMTDRTSKDEDYQICCQVNYLSKQYIETLENALNEIEKILSESQYEYDNISANYEEDILKIKEIIKKVKGK